MGGAACDTSRKEVGCVVAGGRLKVFDLDGSG